MYHSCHVKITTILIGASSLTGATYLTQDLQTKQPYKNSHELPILFNVNYINLPVQELSKY